ncbi:GTPase IMAP family member 9-like [Engraulis encrasicolus]|uniref:GTPase IMAP family member 9-like n=1 Tax=Engraulis encrasicolus TaxID=184585 RepID=UPI002FD6C845
MNMEKDTQPMKLRIVLVEGSGFGKSSTGNTICGNGVFKMEHDITSGCVIAGVKSDGQVILIVDTPALFDPNKSSEEAMRAIANGVALAAPGPHVLLVVLQLGNLKNEDQKAVKIIQGLLGEEAAPYTMVLFTHRDGTEADGVSVEEIIDGSPSVKAFISQCGGGYHVFNNRHEDPSQVRELLEKINTMVQRNGGRYYTTAFEHQAGFATAGAIGCAIGAVITLTGLAFGATAGLILGLAAFGAGVATGLDIGPAAGLACGPAAFGAAAAAAVGAIAAVLNAPLVAATAAILPAAGLVVAQWLNTHT